MQRLRSLINYRTDGLSPPKPCQPSTKPTLTISKAACTPPPSRITIPQAKLPANAQFNRLDPFFGNAEDPQSFNKYAYVHGDPVAGIDPTGMAAIALSVSFSVGFGANVRSNYDSAALASGATVVARLLAVSLTVIAVHQVISTPGIADAIEILITYINQGAQSITAALAAASAVPAIALSALSSLPIFFVPQLVMPNIYALDTAALAANPTWYVLDYMANPAAARTNRRTALRGRGRAGFLRSWDEYPFASTLQGGAGSFVAAVPALENAKQGGYLGAFYQFQLRGVPSPFLIVPIP